MSGIYIPNFDAPECCARCKFFEKFIGIGMFAPIGHCGINGEETLYLHEKNSKCPLIPIPDHGRLIDGDALMEHLVGSHDMWIEYEHINVATDDERIVEEQATVIPASK